MDLDSYALSCEDWGCIGDAFRIDDLSEISNEDIAGPIPSDAMEPPASDGGQTDAPDVHFPPLEEEIGGLEWLTDFLEDSKCDERKQAPLEPQSGAVAQNRMLRMAIPCRARSKRSRVRVWPSEPGDLPWPDKRTRKKQTGPAGAQPRRCTHCQTQKTPQWRAGPLGPKSLCNACGVRYKSGRLLPEYRPAKSPTFVSYKHSNSHKKVLELRRSQTNWN